MIPHPKMLRWSLPFAAMALAACDPDAPPTTADAAPADVGATDTPPGFDMPPPPPDGQMPPPDGAMPPPPDGPPMDRPPPPPDGAMPPPDGAMPPPDGAMPPPDAPRADAAADAVFSDASCASPGTATTPTPPTAATATSNFNVTLLACTRTALALQCELGVGHQYTETVEGTVRRIRANGVPNHDVGPFPNSGNPTAIAPQSYNYAVPVTPSGAGAAARIFGITTAGVVLDPGTAERWNDSMSWSYEALRYATAPAFFNGAGATDMTRHPTALGLDCNFAHVQPGGSYHYHGIPTGLMPATPALTFVGWAGDGYPIYGRWDFSNPADITSALREMRASYRLRSGPRPSGTAGPGGAYDGTFVQDWEYAAGTGDLDECNGRTGAVTLQGRTVTTYHYVLTNTWPYIPRCFHATPDASFAAGMMMPMGDGGVTPMGDAGMMGPRACTTTADCTGACPAGARGCTCSSSPMGMICVPPCAVTADCPAGPMGMALQCRMGVCQP